MIGSYQAVVYACQTLLFVHSGNVSRGTFEAEQFALNPAVRFAKINVLGGEFGIRFELFDVVRSSANVLVIRELIANVANVALIAPISLGRVEEKVVEGVVLDSVNGEEGVSFCTTLRTQNSLALRV